MAITVAELIAKKDEIEKAKKDLYDIETSAGVFTVKAPDKELMLTLMDMTDKADEYLILNTVVEPNLKHIELQNAYDCVEPTDIVGEILKAGEISSLAIAIAKLAGFNKEFQAKLHEEIKK